MESVKQWFQDWSDACEYAKECAPDLSFLSAFRIGEPYLALLAVAGVCWLLWAVNERGIKRRAACLQSAAQAQSGALDGALQDMTSASDRSDKAEKLAA